MMWICLKRIHMQPKKMTILMQPRKCLLLRSTFCLPPQARYLVNPLDHVLTPVTLPQAISIQESPMTVLLN